MYRSTGSRWFLPLLHLLLPLGWLLFSYLQMNHHLVQFIYCTENGYFSCSGQTILGVGLLEGGLVVSLPTILVSTIYLLWTRQLHWIVFERMMWWLIVLLGIELILILNYYYLCGINEFVWHESYGRNWILVLIIDLFLAVAFVCYSEFVRRIIAHHHPLGVHNV